MIKFFRRIRKSLLSENKFSKYLFYAMGEIVLVVIGILIALQINNWNENRAELDYQHTVLDEISRALEADIEKYRENLAVLKQVDSGITGIVKLIKKDPKSVSLGEFYQSANKTVLNITFGYNAGAYEGLRSTGLEKIQNTELRSKIIAYYEVTVKAAKKAIDDNFTFFEERQSEIRETFAKEEVLSSEFLQHRDSLVSINLNINHQKMLAHKFYPEYLKNIMWEGAGHRSVLNGLIDEAEALIKDINKYLKH